MILRFSNVSRHGIFIDSDGVVCKKATMQHRQPTGGQRLIETPDDMVITEAINRPFNDRLNETIYRTIAGKYHRTDGPAVEYEDGTRAWYINGKKGRTDGPAYIDSDGTQEWWINDTRHRTDGPAVIYADGDRLWYQNDELHRTDGPAVIRADGTTEWWINGSKADQLTVMLLQHQTNSVDVVL